MIRKLAQNSLAAAIYRTRDRFGFRQYIEGQGRILIVKCMTQGDFDEIIDKSQDMRAVVGLDSFGS